MRKCSFEEKLGTGISDSDYHKIEVVYLFCPDMNELQAVSFYRNNKSIVDMLNDAICKDYAEIKRIEVECDSLRQSNKTYQCTVDNYRLKIEELETELQQYKAYVSDITAVIQKNICKNFCPNIRPSAD